MSHFIQLHLLITYPPSNLNRDDLGRPKTAQMGGETRLRLSSQSLKRAWRTSELFSKALSGHIGTRTKRLGSEALKRFQEAGVKAADAKAWAEAIAGAYGKAKGDGTAETEQLVHLSPQEMDSFHTLVSVLCEEKRPPTDDELKRLLQTQHAVDIAMFGRMVAAKTEFNEEAAVQVAHAIGVHASAVEDDYFSAVDDLNKDDSGAGHIGEANFGSALFYQYVCIDRRQLLANLGGDEGLTERALRALAEVAMKVGPRGKQASYASRAYAHYVLAEKGDQQPRSLALAFLQPVSGGDYAVCATKALRELRQKFDDAYGACCDAHYEFDVLAEGSEGRGTAEALIDFVATR